jgi:hypothetical protein
MGKIGEQKMARLDAVGEDVILGRIADGESIRTLTAEYDLGFNLFYQWINRGKGRKERYEAALANAGHAYAARAVDTAQNVSDPAEVNMARLKVDTDKWIAGKLNAQYDVRQRESTITLKVEDLHAQAAALIAGAVGEEAIEGEWDSLEDD